MLPKHQKAVTLELFPQKHRDVMRINSSTHVFQDPREWLKQWQWERVPAKSWQPEPSATTRLQYQHSHSDSPSLQSSFPKHICTTLHQFKDYSIPLCSSLGESRCQARGIKLVSSRNRDVSYRVSPVLGYRKESVLLVSSMGDVTWIISTSDSSFSS